MDATSESVSPTQALDITRASTELDQGQAALLDAAREWGIRPHHPEAAFVGALIHTQKLFTQASVAGLVDLGQVIADTRRLSEGDIARQKLMASEASGLMSDLKRLVTKTVSNVQEERRTMQKSMVESLLPVLFKALEKPLVISESRHQRKVILSAFTLCLAVGGALVMLGFSLSVWSDWTGSARLDQLRVAIAKCELRTGISMSNGERYCPLRDLLPTDHVVVRPDVPETRTR